MTDRDSYILTNFKLLTGDSNVDKSQPEAIAISDGHIVAIGQRASMQATETVVDLKGMTVTPGFIDLQLNGCGGVQLNNDISAATLDTMHDANLQSGCTTFLPTLITSSYEDMQQAVELVKDYRQRYPERVPGLHLEGPFLNPQRKGIHNPELIRKPTETDLQFLCDYAEVISMITLAPEICGAGVIRRLSEAGIVVSIGHTNATCAEVKVAEQAGARFATHLHNAMSPLTSREPGVVGAVFDSHLLGAGIIADGYHLSWENLRIAHRIMQDRLVLVSDATAAAGSDIPEFEFGGQTVYHHDGKCVGANGTLGGSALTMIEAVANSITHGITPQDTVRMATVNAAKAIGVECKMGQVALGQYANLAIFNNQYIMLGTISGGVIKID